MHVHASRTLQASAAPAKQANLFDLAESPQKAHVPIDSNGNSGGGEDLDDLFGSMVSAPSLPSTTTNDSAPSVSAATHDDVGRVSGGLESLNFGGSSQKRTLCDESSNDNAFTPLAHLQR